MAVTEVEMATRTAITLEDDIATWLSADHR
jgi:hypothetical protein